MRVGIDARKIADYGIGTYIRGLLRGLIELGTGNGYVAFAPAGAPVPEGVEHVELDAPHYSVRELLIVARAADRARIDVFHAPHYVTPFTRLPLVVTIHDLIHLHQPMRNPLGPLYARMMLRRAIRNASAVLTVSEAVRRELEQELGARNVSVTPNGVDIPPADRQLPTANYFLYVGNDKPHKNVATLVEAFRRVRSELPDVSLVLAGAPFERFGGRDGVDARGFVSDDELAALYRGAVALIVPSHEEGFGLPAAEAMACGTPVVTSTAAALVEVTGDAALHVDAGDVDGFADAMRRLAHDRTLRSALGARGAQRARALTWRRCAELTHAAYAEAHRSSARRRSR